MNLRDKKCSDSLGFCGKQQSEVSENHGCTRGGTIRLIDAWTVRLRMQGSNTQGSLFHFYKCGQ